MLDGMTEEAFSTFAQSVFRTQVAALISGVSIADMTITNIQAVTRRRALLAAGLIVDYEVANFASESAKTAAALSIEASSADLVASLKADTSCAFSELTDVSSVAEVASGSSGDTHDAAGRGALAAVRLWTVLLLAVVAPLPPPSPPFAPRWPEVPLPQRRSSLGPERAGGLSKAVEPVSLSHTRKASLPLSSAGRLGLRAFVGRDEKREEVGWGNLGLAEGGQPRSSS